MEVQPKTVSAKKKERLFLEYLYRIVMFIMAWVTFSYVWTNYYTPLDPSEITQVLKLCLMAFIYSTVYAVFMKFYAAYRLGAYRTTELMYFHFLTLGITNFLFFLEGSVYKHRILNLWPIIGMFLAQWCITGVITLLFNRLTARVCELRKIILVYGSQDYKIFEKEIEKNTLKFKIVGVFEQSKSIDEIVDWVDDYNAVYLYDVDAITAEKWTLYCTVHSIDIYMTRNIEEILMMGYEVSHTFDTPFIRTKKERIKVYYPFLKRMLDIIVSLAGLIIMSPILLIVALAIKLYDGGPVFYKQIRLTKNHREFEILKFRSMITNAERDGKARLATVKDDRITPIGRIIRAIRLDEFPQLINVLKGDMSIVGPRPERPEIEKQYLDELPEFGLRLQVKAGLTGYAQVFGKYNTSPLDKLKLDLIYINEQNIFLDIKLVMWTIKILFIPESTEGIEKGKMTASKSQDMGK